LGPLRKDSLFLGDSAPFDANGTLRGSTTAFLPNGGTQFVPKRFRFAFYFPDGPLALSYMSLFIHIDAVSTAGAEDRLQQSWTAKWSKDNYGVPPIPHPYTARHHLQ